MNALTIQFPDDILEKVEHVARSRDMPIDKFILDVMNAVIREHEAEIRLHEYAARGKGREQEALELLRRK
jgi:predicted transcriptional regulator